MEQHPHTVATLRAPKGLTASFSGHGTEVHNGGIGSGRATPTLGVVPGRRLGRQATLAKGLRLMQPPAALPLFDMSVAVIDSLNLMRASMEEEVVLQSALGVPAHHALACRIEAYGTPFGAPRLQSVVQGELTEDDKQFAACLAAPPDSDAIGSTTPEISLQRMASLNALQRTPSLAARGEEASTPTPLTPSSAIKRGSELLRSPSIQTEKKNKKGPGTYGGMGTGSGPISDAVVGLEDLESAAAAAAPADVSTPAGRAAAAAAAAERQQQWSPFEGCGDVVSALVGTGYLLMRAAGFSQQAPKAVERLSTGLKRMSMRRAASGGDVVPFLGGVMAGGRV